ncbi:MAG: hypothetical protein ABIF85_04290 [Nanoarchaeota archaeon]|nr:hypothetical protein [Nanoarchaeota archaeon]MBU4300620.1 hypothetical protein [Nanoarchaeota archaeon]MBU4452173.1 hypothetical protein [Nanoarchaeota archaeon]MCG2724213.1 hypothetical protein [archaeon]
MGYGWLVEKWDDAITNNPVDAIRIKHKELLQTYGDKEFLSKTLGEQIDDVWIETPLNVGFKKFGIRSELTPDICAISADCAYYLAELKVPEGSKKSARRDIKQCSRVLVDYGLPHTCVIIHDGVAEVLNIGTSSYRTCRKL